MTFQGSVSQWIVALRGGEEEALGRLHQRYWPMLVNLARRRLKGAPGRAADEEDVAQETFWNFYRTLKAGKLPDLANRHDLWALLSHIISCRAVNQIQHELGVKKRGAGVVQGGSALERLSESGTRHGIEPADEKYVTPLEQVILNDCYEQYLGRLPDNLKPFAERYLAGVTHKEIALELSCAERTVERKIAMILKQWRAQAADSLELKTPA